MRGVHVRGDSRLIARPAAPAVAQRLAVLQAESRETAKQSNEWYDTRFAGSIQEKVSPEELQEVIWKQFFADAAQWWNKRGRKPTTMLPEFRPEASSISEWSNNHQWPMFVDPRLLRSGAALITTSTFVQEVAAREDHVEVEKCRKLCEDGLVSDAVDALDQLVQRGYRVPNNILYRVLKGCGQDRNLALGRRIHSLTVRSGYEGDAFLATHLIVFYASCGRLQEAMEVFIKVPTPSAHNWATIIFAYARHGDGTEAARAIELYRRMRQLNTVQSDNRLFSAVLKACTAAKDIVAAREVHADILASSNKPDKFVQSGLVNMYAKCGCLEDARNLFDKLSYRNVVTWNAMIAGYAQQGMGKQALSLYRSMQLEGLTTPDSITYACLLQACAGIGVDALDAGKQLHAEIRERGLQDNLIIGTSLVNMHAKCGSLDDARRLFDILPEKTSAAWNAMYTGHVPM